MSKRLHFACMGSWLTMMLAAAGCASPQDHIAAQNRNYEDYSPNWDADFYPSGRLYFWNEDIYCSGHQPASRYEWKENLEESPSSHVEKSFGNPRISGERH